MVGEMFVRGNVLAGKCPVGEESFGEVSVRGNVRRGSVSRGFVLGEVSGRETGLEKQTCKQTCESCIYRHFRKCYFTFPLI